MGKQQIHSFEKLEMYLASTSKYNFILVLHNIIQFNSVQLN